MKRLRQAIRALLVVALLVAVVVPATLFMVLSTPWAQEKIRGVAQSELTALLGTPVSIGRIDYHPFNTLSVSDICVLDSAGVKALSVERLSARFELAHLLRTGRLLVDYAVIDAPQVALSRPSASAPLNIQPIIDRLSPKDKSKPPTHFDVKIATLVVLRGGVSYDVADVPETPGRFNPAHIAVSEFGLHAYLRQATPERYDMCIEALGLREQSGFVLTDLQADAVVSASALSLRKLSIDLPQSHLAIAPLSVALEGFDSIISTLRRSSVAVATLGTSTINPADLSAFVPGLEAWEDMPLTLSFTTEVSAREAAVHSLRLTGARELEVELSGQAAGFGCSDSLQIAVDLQRLHLAGADMASALKGRHQPVAEVLRRFGRVELTGHISATTTRAQADIDGCIDGGRLQAAATAHTADQWRTTALEASVGLQDVDLGSIARDGRLGSVTLQADASATLDHHRQPQGEAAVDIASAQWNGHTYTDISLQCGHGEGGTTLSLLSGDPAASLSLEGSASLLTPLKLLDAELHVTHLDPSALGYPNSRGITLRGNLHASLRGHSIDDIEGRVGLSEVMLRDAAGDSLALRHFVVTAQQASSPETLEIESDYINGILQGRLNPTTIGASARDMAAHVVPALIDCDENLHRRLDSDDTHNCFAYTLTIDHAEPLSRFFKLPVQLIYPVEIVGDMDTRSGTASVSVDAPYLLQGDKIIDSTIIWASVSSQQNRANVYATTHMPTKKGPMTAVVGISGADSRFDTRIDWQIDRKIPLSGTIPFSTALSRSDRDGQICVDNTFSHGQITFGDDVWTISPSTISWCDGQLAISDFCLDASPQRIAIDGVASASPDDTVTVQLDSIHLISIFETLEIENALIGGTATGTFSACQALSKVPMLTTDNLHVDSIGYNYCTLGTADISARWDNDRQSFFLDADIVNPQQQHSRISGDIFPASESLDLNFDARHVKVGFMQPFMAAFASDISGYVSGRARLFGTFKDIDMDADIYADSLRLKIDFTNTYYTASDSIHVRPGRIELDDITIRDVNGHTAQLNGVLTHEYFHYPAFDFRISQAHDFLSYNVTPRINPDWYGTIYGNGGATIKGSPGVIEIGVNMSTAAESTFTFVLSDHLEAEQYSFITFNDATVYSEEEVLLQRDDTPDIVRQLRQRLNTAAADQASNYIMDIRVDITPEAQIILVMDPVGGDRIKAYGSGDLRMTYDAAENDLRMYGTYTLDRGSYNFTLQDIIIKDFTINPGSSITFRGDPYSAQLNLEAVYQVNANLSDLDESFTQDKDLNRTNVPVQALMKVTGDMRQPDLAFDLAFPTLTSDTYRKVRSIISTDDMMNRQIIYLLALNRFYTPDYMASTTKGNELFSVASSTISSQLSSMLGKLSEHWSIAPNLRSDRGDFSDVEVDVALSSRLLNNRLLFNGNFGYRDKSLNTNQFIGDFDIEYLLTPRGTWRLKAYNRYNDQNYYVRSATTTQGVGIMFRRDFDSLFRRRPTTTPTDTVK